MKSKLYSMMGLMVLALTLAAAAQAQDRPDSGTIQVPVKIDLPCKVAPVSSKDTGGGTIVITYVEFTTNNTNAWMPQGKVLYHKKNVFGDVPNGSFTLKDMVPPGSKIIFDTFDRVKKYPMEVITCQAWYFN
jgi:hypothetical protein